MACTCTNCIQSNAQFSGVPENRVVKCCDRLASVLRRSPACSGGSFGTDFFIMSRS
ncbi:hypothetical protein X805_10560 [Sphaerotilus natans subsp. natans DSM 6575]|uniref:Uncharacterized protein n=1 Tax=Sphaerotilus natans subsp. natans DSM 6575 TaxID=1286631 RepID=A0A059KPC4_9BURK|nr:hypothetical protein X805_10560 [Sphaerotilus natans subsp. natans DSM 6575]